MKKLSRCQCCCYPVDRRYRMVYYNGEKRCTTLVCRFCASTAAIYYDTLRPIKPQSETGDILKAICYIGNAIVAAIDGRPKPDPLWPVEPVERLEAEERRRDVESGKVRRPKE